MEKTKTQLLNDWKEDAEVWKAECKKPFLFWSGRLAIASGMVVNSAVRDLSDNVRLLYHVLAFYNAAIEEATRCGGICAHLGSLNKCTFFTDCTCTGFTGCEGYHPC